MRKAAKKITMVLLALMLAAAVAVFAACGDSPAPEPHKCMHVCTEADCGLCTSDCTDPVCKDKCKGHTPDTPPELTVASITLDASAAKTKYDVGDTFDESDVTVTAKMSDDSQKTVNIGDCTVSKPDMTTAGKKSVTVEYGGKSDSYEITVYNNYFYNGKCAEAVGVTAGEDGVYAGLNGKSGYTVTYRFTANKAGKAVLTVKTQARGEEPGINLLTERYKITVNGIDLEGEIIIRGGEWSFVDVTVGEIDIKADAENEIVLTGVSADGFKGGDLAGIGLKTTDEFIIVDPPVSYTFTAAMAEHSADISVNGSGVFGLNEHSGYTIAYAFTVNEDAEGTLYFDTQMRTSQTNLLDRWKITINGVELTEPIAIANDADWAGVSVEIGKINLKKDGENTVEIYGKHAVGSGADFCGMRLKTPVTVTPIAPRVNYTFTAADATQKSADLTVDQNNAFNGLNGKTGYSFGFTFNAAGGGKATLIIKTQARGEEPGVNLLTERYKITVNGTDLGGKIIIRGNEWWFIDVEVGEIDLIDGENTITFTGMSDDAAKGGDFMSMTLISRAVITTEA